MIFVFGINFGTAAVIYPFFTYIIFNLDATVLSTDIDKVYRSCSVCKIQCYHFILFSPRAQAFYYCTK